MTIRKKAIKSIKYPIFDIERKSIRRNSTKGNFCGHIKIRTIHFHTTFLNITKTNILPTKKDTYPTKNWLVWTLKSGSFLINWMICMALLLVPNIHNVLNPLYHHKMCKFQYKANSKLYISLSNETLYYQQCFDRY